MSCFIYSRYNSLNLMIRNEIAFHALSRSLVAVMHRVAPARRERKRERIERLLFPGWWCNGTFAVAVGEATMSTQCNRFVQNAWKKELCSNCFKPREEHAATDDILRLNVEKASTNLKIGHLQLQVYIDLFHKLHIHKHKFDVYYISIRNV